MTKLYIFDADGTLRWTTVPGQRYPLTPSQWQLMPGVAERLQAIPWSASGPWLAIAFNQDGVAAGEITEDDAYQLIEDMLAMALGQMPPGTRIAMCVCGEGTGCRCRKPEPGLLEGHLRYFGVTPEDALFVGDLESDAEAARRAGIAFRFASDFFS